MPSCDTATMKSERNRNRSTGVLIGAKIFPAGAKKKAVAMILIVGCQKIQ